MPGTVQHYAYAVCNGTSDIADVAMPQVQPQFFQRILHLAPWMIPRIKQKHALLIFCVLSDLLRMREWKCQIMPPHCEDAAQTTWH